MSKRPQDTQMSSVDGRMVHLRIARLCAPFTKCKQLSHNVDVRLSAYFITKTSGQALTKLSMQDSQ